MAAAPLCWVLVVDVSLPRARGRRLHLASRPGQVLLGALRFFLGAKLQNLLHFVVKQARAERDGTLARPRGGGVLRGAMVVLERMAAATSA